MSKTLPIVVITGGSSGIGKSLAEQFARDGYFVIIASRSKEKLNSIRNQIESQGYSCLDICVDVSSPDDIKSFTERVMGLGSVSVLINNAGIAHFGSIESIPIESWNSQINVNLRGAFLLSQAFIPAMKKSKKGSIVFINSIAGRQPFTESSVYVTSKFGLRGMANSFREELRQYNIKVISVFPGATDTPFWKKFKNNFPPDEMLNANDLATMISNSIKTPGNMTVEEITIRRVAGDF